MSSVLKSNKVTRAYFLAYLDSIDHKAEYLDGEIFDMAGGTVAHNLASGNIYAELRAALRNSGCRAYTSDLLIEITEDHSLVFPDAFVVCGEVELVEGREDIVKNPTLVVEVLSKERADYDRGGKFTKYRSIPSLSEYVLVDQYSMKVDVFFRTASGFWDIQTYQDLESPVHLQSIDVKVSMAEIYRDVVFRKP